MLTALALSSAATTSALLYALRRHQHHAHDAHAQEVNDQLNIPILGVKESGKTLLLATLGAQLTSTKTEDVTTRLLSHVEEERARGRSLKTFNPDDPQQPYLAPGERTTAAMVAFERQSFEGEGVNRTSALPESAYFSLQFATTGPLSGQKLCVLEDIPGEHMMEERSHKSTMIPAIKRADGLVLVIDGHKAINAPQGHLPEYTLYQQALEEYFKREHHGPIWVIITKADLLSEEHQEVAWWHGHALEHITPLLKLKDQRASFEVSLVSAKESCEGPWAEVRRAGEAFFVSLKSVLTHRLEVERAQAEERARWKKISAAALAASALSLWATVGAYQVERLPSVKGERAWDHESLKVATAPRLEALARSNSPLSPLALYRRQLINDLSALREAHWRLTRQRAQAWGASLKALDDNSAESKKALKDAQDLLSLSLKSAVTFNDARSAERPWSEEERQLEEQLKSALSDLDKLPSLSASQELRGLHGAWLRRCQLKQRDPRQEQPFECAVAERVDGQLRGVRLSALSSAQRVKVSAELPTQLTARLTPLLTWAQDYGEASSSGPLKVRFKEAMHTAWVRSWEHIKASLADERYEADPVASLDLLRQLELERVALSRRFGDDLEAPSEVHLAWRERLNKTSVLLRERSQGLSPQAQREADALTEWAAPFLDPKRRARVRFQTKLAHWQATLKEAFQQPNPAPFQASLSDIASDLEQLSSEEGRASIEEDLKTWEGRLKELRAWAAPERVKLSATEVSCDFKALDDEGLSHGAGSSWDSDLFSPYLSLNLALAHADTSTERVILEGEVSAEDDEALFVRWRPWQSVSVELYELDGEVDGAEEVDEDDDHLISGHKVWQPKLTQPSEEVKLTPKGSCVATLTLHHALPAWVRELGLVSAQP